MLINVNCFDMFELFCLMAFNLKLEAFTKKINEVKLWNAFKYFDVDNSDYITEENLINAMKKAEKKLG